MLAHLLYLVACALCETEYRVGVSAVSSAGTNNEAVNRLVVSSDAKLFGSINRGMNGLFRFEPALEASEVPKRGCIGVLRDSDPEFVCQSLYELPEAAGAEASLGLEAAVSPTGELFQFQLTRGKLGDFSISPPSVVRVAGEDRIEDPVVRRSRSEGGAKVEEPEDEDEAEEPPSRNWKFLIITGALAIGGNVLAAKLRASREKKEE